MAKSSESEMERLKNKTIILYNIEETKELDIIKRGRNYKRSSHPKNTDIVTYKMSTGVETLIGYLYLSNNITRLKEILEHIEVI